LREKELVEFKCFGDKMQPLAEAGDYCLIEPVLAETKLKVGDTVFAELPPCHQFVLQKIIKTEMSRINTTAESAEVKYFIGSDAELGLGCGMCLRDCIYGRLVEVTTRATVSAPESSAASAPESAEADAAGAVWGKIAETAAKYER